MMMMIVMARVTMVAIMMVPMVLIKVKGIQPVDNPRLGRIMMIMLMTMYLMMMAMTMILMMMMMMETMYLMMMTLMMIIMIKVKDIHGEPVDNPRLGMMEAVCISFFTIEFLLRY